MRTPSSCATSSACSGLTTAPRNSRKSPREHRGREHAAGNVYAHKRGPEHVDAREVARVPLHALELGALQRRLAQFAIPEQEPVDRRLREIRIGEVRGEGADLGEARPQQAHPRSRAIAHVDAVEPRPVHGAPDEPAALEHDVAERAIAQIDLLEEAGPEHSALEGRPIGTLIRELHVLDEHMRSVAVALGEHRDQLITPHARESVGHMRKTAPPRRPPTPGSRCP